MLELDKIYNMDCIEGMKQIPDHSIDCVITDPPYGLSFMGKKWDYNIPSIEIWKQCLRVLKPGGYLLSFGGTRTQHRMVCAIEDAGFEIRDMIAWVYGSGFPKSLNIGKAVDKLQGNDREDLGVNNNQRLNKPEVDVYEAGIRGKEARLTKGTSEWEGWGTALKPALEPITVARKPLSEKTVAKNVLKWGTGGINIDGCRIGLNGEQPPAGSAKRVYASNEYTEDKIYGDNKETSLLGRFPANLIHDGSDDVLKLFPNSKGQQGNVRGTEKSHTGDENTTCYGEYKRIPQEKRGDSGSASRFFYCAKASKSERNVGCNGLEKKEAVKQFNEGMEGKLRSDGTVIKESIKHQNNHPTVKPIALMKYLIKLVSREGALILDPFAGSGTTGIACRKLNRHFIGFEINEDYYNISLKRL